MSSVEIARLRLREAEQREEEEHKANLIARLKAVREGLRQAIERYTLLAGEIKMLREKEAAAQAEVTAALEQVSAHYSVRPAVADYLPDDPLVAEWNAAHARLEARVKRLMEKRDAIHPETNFMEAVQYEGPLGIIAQLENSEAGLLSVLRGRMTHEGGLTAVR